MSPYLIMFLLAFPMQVEAKVPKLHVNVQRLIHGVIQKENPKRDRKLVGDKHLKHHAYGLFQIRAGYLADVNRLAGKKEIMRVWHKKKLTLKDMEDSRKAQWVFLFYTSYYGWLYRKKTGEFADIETCARIHNGGPDGWKKRNTRKYGKDVAQYGCMYHPQKHS